MKRGPLSSRSLVAGLFGLALAGCGGNQDALRPESGAERSIANLWWVMLGGSAVGFASVLFLLYLGWRRRRRLTPGAENARLETTLVVALGVGVPVIILLALFVYSDVFVMRSTAAPAPGATRLTVDVVGHQWFWEVRYPGTPVVTANEIHIPVRTPVDVVGTTADVIHSFWVPQLNRKIDLIPGRTNRVLLEADRPGRYRGQCSEFCGLQHAHMAVLVIAESRAQFRAWLANQSTQARAPSTCRRGAGGARLPGAGVRRLPHDSRHVGARCDRARPDAPRLAADDRRAHAAKRPRLAALVDCGRPAREAGSEDARAPAQLCRS